MKRTLFLNPPSYKGFDGGAGSRYQAKREIVSFWYPTWLCSAAGLLPGSRVIDAPPHNLSAEEVLRQAKDYDLVVLFTSSPSAPSDAKFAERLKDAYPGITVGFVGAHPTVLPEKTLNLSPAIDFVVRGEFDWAIPAVARGDAWDSIPGLCYRKNGSLCLVEEAEPIQNLDDLPFAAEVYARDLDYTKYFIGYLYWPYVSVYTGRGCPARCTFCLWPQTIGGHKYRTRSVENVLREVEYIRSAFPKMRELFFDDDTFTADRPRAREISRGLGKLGLTWSCNARADVDYDTLAELRDNGLRLFVVGFESGNQEILKNIKKGILLEQAKRFAKNCRKLGIAIHGTFIVGLPGETKETLENSIRFSQEVDPHTIQVSLASPYPGTEFYDWVEKNRHWAGHPLVSDDGFQLAAVEYEGLSAEEIALAAERFYREFYFRPKKIAEIVWEMVRDRQMLVRRLRDGRDFMKFMAARRAYLRRKAACVPSS